MSVAMMQHVEPTWPELLSRRGIQPPANYQEAADRCSLINGELADINAQLEARRPVERISEELFSEYLNWKRRAMFARSVLIQEQMALGNWARYYRRQHHQQTAPDLKLKQRSYLRKTLARCVWALQQVEDLLDDEQRDILDQGHQCLQDTSLETLEN